MRLSEAIMLGSTTCKMEPLNINSCAYGCALNALGVPKDESVGVDGEHLYRYVALKKIWPWTADAEVGMSDLGVSVYQKFDSEVCEGEITLEQLADYVRSIEPDCGECNRFNCTCAKSEAVPESVEAVCQL